MYMYAQKLSWAIKWFAVNKFRGFFHKKSPISPWLRGGPVRQLYASADFILAGIYEFGYTNDLLKYMQGWCYRSSH